MKNYCDYCYNVIYNTTPLVLLDRSEDVRSLTPKALRMHFTTEDRNTVREMLALYEKVFVMGEPGEEPDMEFTRGHFKRGIK